MWFTLTALAAAPSPARQCAESAEGSAIEVCLRLAATHPEQADAIAAALRALIDRTGSTERTLTRALLLLEDPRTAIDGTRVLGALDDPRILQPLVNTVHQAGPSIAAAAVDALAGKPAALPWFRDWLFDPHLPLEVRIRVAHALGRDPSRAAADLLVDSSRHIGLPRRLRAAMESALETGHPDRASEYVDRISRRGTAWLTVSGGASVGYLLAAVGRFSRPEVAAAGAGAGTLAGGTFGYLLAKDIPTEAGDAAFITTNGLIGTGAGLALGFGSRRQDLDRAAWAGVIGEGIGLGSGLLLAHKYDGEPVDSIEAGMMGIAAAGLIGGALHVGAANGLSDPRATGTNPALTGMGIGLLAGTSLGHVIAPNIRYQRNDWALVGIATGTGALVGLLAPVSDSDRSALPAVGAAAGALTGLALAGSIDPGLDALGSGAVGAAFGGLLVGGTSIWIAPERPELAKGLALIGGVAGLAGGGILADLDDEPIDDRDVMLTAYSTAWVAGHVIALNYGQRRRTLDPIGPILAVPAATGAAFVALQPVLDVPVAHSSAAFSLGLWGSYVGGSVGEIFFDQPITGGVIGADAGLLAGSIAMSRWVGTTPDTISLANAGGLVGGATGLLTVRLFDRQSDRVLVGSLVGAGAGFVGGALAARSLRRSGLARGLVRSMPRIPRIPLHPAPAAFEGTYGAVYGLRLEADPW